MAGTYDTSVRSYRFYRRNNPVLTNAFQEFVFIDQGDLVTNFLSQGVIVANDDAANEIQFSYDGVTVEGDLLPQESMNFFALRRKRIWLRGVVGGEDYRIWAW